MTSTYFETRLDMYLGDPNISRNYVKTIASTSDASARKVSKYLYEKLDGMNLDQAKIYIRSVVETYLSKDNKSMFELMMKIFEYQEYPIFFDAESGSNPVGIPLNQILAIYRNIQNIPDGFCSFDKKYKYRLIAVEITQSE